MSPIVGRLVDVAHLLPLRTAVLRPHYAPGRMARYDVDDNLETTRHYGLILGGRLQGCATIMVEEAPFEPGQEALRLRGMATADGARGQGLGARLLEVAMGDLRASFPGIDLLWCNARQRAFSFYTRLGFLGHGELFDLPAIGPHQVMWRELANLEARPVETIDAMLIAGGPASPPRSA